MSPTKFTRRKVSSLAQLSGSKAPTEQPLSPKSGQKRKLQPELKDRAEAFLNAASRSTSTPSTPTKKPIKRRKMSAKEATIDIKSVDTPGAHKTNSPKRSSKKAQSDKGSPSKNSSPEKRPRTTRKKPPLSYLEKLERAQTQRMIVIDRVRKDTEACPVEDISVVGTTGNVYKVTISQTPSCTCPDFLKRAAQCKHMVYVLHNVLKAPEFLQYQLAFLTSELREIFANAPPIPTKTSSSQDTSGKRKPVEGECPICYMDFDEDNNELVWCKASCGNNMHKTCFDQWAASQAKSGVKCVYCRAPWHVDPGSTKEMLKTGKVNEEGYVNVASQFGLTGERDTSSYYPYWARRMGFRGHLSH